MQWDRSPRRAVQAAGTAGPWVALAAYLPWVTAQGRGLCGPTQARGAIVRSRLRLPVNKPRGVLGGQLEQRSPDTRGPQGSEAQGPSLAGQPRGTRRLSPGRGARYLHDRLGEVPRAPVTEARLHRGRDEALVSGSIVRVIGRLRALGKQRRETSQSGGPRLCAPPTPALPTRPAAPWPLGALPCRPHCCALVTGTRVSGQNSRAPVLGSARSCTRGALSPGPARWLRLPPTLSWLHMSPGPGPHRPLPRGCGSTQARRPAS